MQNHQQTQQSNPQHYFQWQQTKKVDTQWKKSWKTKNELGRRDSKTWDHIKKDMTGLTRFMAFDDSNPLIMDIIKEHAKKPTKDTPVNNIT